MTAQPRGCSWEPPSCRRHRSRRMSTKCCELPWRSINESWRRPASLFRPSNGHTAWARTLSVPRMADLKEVRTGWTAQLNALNRFDHELREGLPRTLADLGAPHPRSGIEVWRQGHASMGGPMWRKPGGVTRALSQPKHAPRTGGPQPRRSSRPGARRTGSRDCSPRPRTLD